MAFITPAPTSGMSTTTDRDGGPADPERCPFDAIWHHYLMSRFIYAAKLERLGPSIQLIQRGWPLLLDAPKNLFQFHAVQDEGTIISSICAFRDTSETYVVQHAASSGQPLGMLDCIRNCLQSINADSTFGFAKMYFRPENRWPTRAANAIAQAMPPSHSILTTDAYLTCHPDRVLPRILSVHQQESRTSRLTDTTESYWRLGSDPPAAHLRVTDLPADDYIQASNLAVRALGTLRAASFGLLTPLLPAPVLSTPPQSQTIPDGTVLPSTAASGAHPSTPPASFLTLPSHPSDLLLHDLNRRYMESGLHRTRRILAAFDDNHLVGLAICYSASVPINFSYLCSRTEILVEPMYEKRDVAITALARASIVEAAARGDPITALLIPPEDIESAKHAGYVNSGKQYSCFTWMRENSAGAPSAIAGVEHLYAHALQLTNRH